MCVCVCVCVVTCKFAVLKNNVYGGHKEPACLFRKLWDKRDKSNNFQLPEDGNVSLTFNTTFSGTN